MTASVVTAKQPSAADNTPQQKSSGIDLLVVLLVPVVHMTVLPWAAASVHPHRACKV